MPSLVLLLSLALPARAATETRTFHDAEGRPVRTLVLVDGTLASETTLAYTDARLTRKTTTEGTRVTEETWTWDGANPLTHAVIVDGTPQRKETWSYADGRVQVATLEEAGGLPTRTTYTYDALGNPTEVVTLREDGAVLSRTLAEFQVPRVPIHFAFTGGGAYQSDLRVASVTSAFAISREPPPTLWSVDPLEFKVGLGWTWSRSGDTLVNNQLTGNFSMDYNHLVPRTTLFLFATMERNPVANLHMDLILAPVGLKVDLVEGSKFRFDASFAPVWNYRSIEVAEGGTCDGSTMDAAGSCETNKLRGSLRVRAKVDTRSVDVSDTLGWLPNLDPAGMPGALWSDAIFQNTTALSIALSRSLTLAETFVYTLDPTLRDQADCAADPDDLLCAGVKYSTNTSLTLAFDVR